MNPVYTGFLLPPLLWVRDNESENYQKCKYVCLPKDYLRRKLIGNVASDYSDASAMLTFDIKNNMQRTLLLLMKKIIRFIKNIISCIRIPILLVTRY